LPEELIFSGKYNSLNIEEKYDLLDAKTEDIIHILCKISEAIDSAAYSFAGIENRKIDEFIKTIVKGTGLQAAISSLESVSSSQLKQVFESCCKSKDFFPIAESYFIHTLLSECKVSFKLSPKFFNSSIAPKKELRPGKIVFIANYHGWVSIKKLSLENVLNYEVAGILSSINFTIINKSFEFAGLLDEAKVSSIVAGKRKSLSALIDCLKSIDEKDEKKLAYLICKVCESLGYTPYSTPNMLTKAYPDIKPPKVKGRVAK